MAKKPSGKDMFLRHLVVEEVEETAEEDGKFCRSWTATQPPFFAIHMAKINIHEYGTYIEVTYKVAVTKYSYPTFIRDAGVPRPGASQL